MSAAVQVVEFGPDAAAARMARALDALVAATTSTQAPPDARCDAIEHAIEVLRDVRRQTLRERLTQTLEALDVAEAAIRALLPFAEAAATADAGERVTVEQGRAALALVSRINRESLT